MTVKNWYRLWSNFHGLSMIALIAYLTLPWTPSNDDGAFGGTENVNG